MANSLEFFTWQRPAQPTDESCVQWTDECRQRIRAAHDNVSRLPPDLKFSMEESDLRWLRVCRKLKTEDYAPLSEEPALFRIFADTEPSEAGFLEFAKQYGFLTEPEVFPKSDYQGRFDGDKYLRAGSLSGWKADQSELAEAIQIFDRRRKRRKSVDDGELLDLVNRGLRGHRAGVLLDDESSTGLGLALIPDSLSSAMWLQLAQEMTATYRCKQCEGCGAWFKAGDLADQASRRSDAVLCSDLSCKMRAIRKRQKAHLGKAHRPRRAQ